MRWLHALPAGTARGVRLGGGEGGGRGQFKPRLLLLLLLLLLLTSVIFIFVSKETAVVRIYLRYAFTLVSVTILPYIYRRLR